MSRLLQTLPGFGRRMTLPLVWHFLVVAGWVLGGLAEGALPQAAIARWPGVVPAGVVREEPWAFWDFLA